MEWILRNKISSRKQLWSRQSIVDCWRATRFNASAIRTLISLNIVRGPEAKLINISKRGALIESPEYISPASRISLRLVTAEEAYLIKGRIIRCSASSKKDNALKYQFGIVFDEDFASMPVLLMWTDSMFIP